jgi:PAS domain S-box-containing protein
MLAKDGRPNESFAHNRLMTETYRVLIVDDDPVQTSLVKDFLRIAGIPESQIAHSIREMLDNLKAEQFDIVLLDYRLPDGNGLQALDAIKKADPEVPVIMVTGQGDERVAVQALQHGAVEYLLKAGDYLITLPSLIRKAVESNQLQQSIERSLEKNRYQALLLNNVRDAMVVWDMDGLITYWNPAAEGLYGIEAIDRIGQPITEVYLNTFDPPIQLLDPEQTTGQYIERRYQHPFGRDIWVSSRMAVLRDTDPSGRLIGYMDVSHDITQSKQAEQALRESEARYRAIVEDYQTELICRFTPDGNLTFVNEVFCSYFGIRRDTLLRMNLFSLILEADQNKVKEHLALFGPDHTAAMLEHQIQLPKGPVRWFQRTDRAIFDDMGRLFEFQSVGRDITARKEMEQQIKVAQTHLAQAARMATLGELASGVAHQINNPLTTIIADAKLLLRDIPEDHPGRESAEAIEQAGWRLLEVVKRLVDFSRPAADTLQPVSVNDTIKNAMVLVSAQIDKQNVRLEPSLSAELPSVRGDERQLEDVWVNLLILARDATAGRPDCSIQILSKSDPRGWVQVEVIDNGTPIPVYQLESIFEPNFVGPSSGRGTGLELSICREIIRQLGGEIIAESTPMNETVIRVSLPPDQEISLD